jgi:peptidoglycan-associated lipoprotein
MRRDYSHTRHVFWGVCCLTLLLGLSESGYGMDPVVSAYVPGEILVKFKPGVRPERIQEVHSGMGIIKRSQVALTGVQRIKLPAGLSVEEATMQYRSQPDVEYAEPNYTRRAFAAPVDPFFGRQWGHHNIGQTLGGTFPLLSGTVNADVNTVEAWDIVRGSQNLVVAVIDSGVDYTHPDLSSNLWTNPGEDPWSIPENPTTGNGVDTDGNGLVDDWKGWNFVGNQTCTIGVQGQCDCTAEDPIGNNDPMDELGHGTPVAGIIAAQGDNRVGVTGVMWTARIMPLKVLDAVGCGNVGDEIQAIDYAIRNGARIISITEGGGSYQQSEFEAVQAAGAAGVLVVAAAGNARSNNDASPVYPAGYDLPNVISVAASDFNDDPAYFSNYGKKSVHLAAPGVCIFSTMPTGVYTLQNQTNVNCTDIKYLPDYDYNTGTSFAASFVAGIAGLLVIQNPSLTPPDLKAILIGTADPKPSLKDKVISDGRVNAFRALDRDPGAGFSGGKAGKVGCGGIDRVGGDGPVSPGSAAASLLVMILPLLLASRNVRKMLRSRRGTVFFFVIVTPLLLSQFKASVAYAQAGENIEMAHRLALKMGFHLYRNSEYFNTNDPFFDKKDLSSTAGELEYEYLWFPPSSMGFSIGYYEGGTDFNSICCSRVKFSNLYERATLKLNIKPAKLRPLEFYLGTGMGFNHFERSLTVLDAHEKITRRVFDIHFVAGARLNLASRLALLLESRYATARIRHSNGLDDILNIGGLTTFLGVSWRYPDLRHFFPSRPPEVPEKKFGPPEVSEERVIPPGEKPLEERPEPEEKAQEETAVKIEPELREVQFGYDDWIIPLDAKPVLEEDARWLQGHPDVKVTLEGHCDQRGTNEYNLALGQRRAEAVKRVLVILGIDESRLSVTSYGEEQPICLESTEACFAKNRRVQFTLR